MSSKNFRKKFCRGSKAKQQNAVWQLRVKGCHRDYVGFMAAVPQVAADLLQRQSRQPWAKRRHRVWRKTLQNSKPPSALVFVQRTPETVEEIGMSQARAHRVQYRSDTHLFPLLKPEWVSTRTLAMVKSSRTAIDAIVEEYLRALQAYAGVVQLPGLKLDRPPALLLDKIFIEPRLTSSEKTTQTEDGKAARVDLAEPTPSRLTSSEKTTQTQDGKAARVDLTEPKPELASSILAREQSLVLLAEPGRGKSTLLRQYAWKLASNTNRSRFPILVQLGRSPDKIEDSDLHFAWLYERLPEVPKNKLGTRGWAAVCSVINAGGASILIDGFDELTRQAQRQVSELMHTLKGNQVVLTSRPHEYRLMEFNEPLHGSDACAARSVNVHD